MGVIPQTFNNLPIGRQITRTIGTITETGVVHGLQRSSSPGWNSIYSVNWSRPDTQDFLEELALSTIQSYYSDSDLYMDEPYVVDEIRLLQKVCESFGYHGLLVSVKAGAIMMLQPGSCSTIGTSANAPRKAQPHGKKLFVNSCMATLTPQRRLPRSQRSGKSQVPRTWPQQQPEMLPKLMMLTRTNLTSPRSRRPQVSRQVA